MHHITHEIGFATLLVLFLSEGATTQQQKPQGLLAQPHVSPNVLAAYGIGVI